MSPGSENPYAGQGAVLLDIGGDVGALLVEVPAAMVGVEIEARALDDRGAAHHHPHVAVVERPAAGGPVPSLVFATLREGSYQLVAKGAVEVALTASVRGGTVTELTWPEG
jgi:hypothetical protein